MKLDHNKTGDRLDDQAFSDQDNDEVAWPIRDPIAEQFGVETVADDIADQGHGRGHTEYGEQDAEKDLRIEAVRWVGEPGG